MDKKMKKYIGWILTIGLIVLGLNALFGGAETVVGGYALLPVFAIVTPLYYILTMRKP